MDKKIIHGFQQAEFQYAVHFCLEDALGYGVARDKEGDEFGIGKGFAVCGGEATGSPEGSALEAFDVFLVVVSLID